MKHPNVASISSTTFTTFGRPASAWSVRLQYSSPAEIRPIVPRRNLYRPQGVMNVVRCWHEASRGTCQYPCTASSDEKNLASLLISETASLGDLRGWVGRLTWTFSLVISTHNRSLPLGFCTTTRGWAQSDGSETDWMMPQLTISSSARLTSSLWANGMGRAPLTEKGIAPSLSWISIGGPIMTGSVPFTSKTSENSDMSCCLIRTISARLGNGWLVRRMWRSSGSGYSSGKIPSRMHACHDKSKPVVCGQMMTVSLEVRLPYSMATTKRPTDWTGWRQLVDPHHRW